MPTGYTAAIKDGITFKKFAMNCARAFGACVMLRDEAGGGEKIPEEFQPSTWNAERAEKKRAELQRLLAMSDDEASAEMEKLEAERRERNETWRAERKELRAKYLEMLRKVNAWTPPTTEHEAFKKFMVEQIEGSIQFDCSEYSEPMPKKLSPSDWRASKVRDVQIDIHEAEKDHAEELKRTAERNLWITNLRNSLEELS